ncbi:MAG: hypothetical protein A2817_03815 [Candidatus Yanofskybacteria bacterium RIFCSPHIGHO2_01_FULL_39_8b]|uniref:DUF6998 domain-containing protein n=1 Tax=Candidatus Yanofskybacteria bacterium RIFCSPHIGHO2_01_FULL_39_8b TaxID=1802659 RepID=A0A1F8EH30_9BACT|nr:MAG: hypothetical protein A2817_03815 [Candidatus Yanofskybacteria bacterium RIFCSPHIGHO2_01_FULL_39_8b]
MTYLTITDEIKKMVNKIIKIALEYETLTGRKLGITGEIAEIIVCHKLGLKLLANSLSPGHDAVDERGNKFQIKSKRIIKNKGRIGRFSMHKFDYLITILFDKNYKIIGIYKTNYKKIMPIINKHKRRNPSVREIVKVSKVIQF